MVFSGIYNHTIDSKGRLIIPAKFREGLGQTFYILQGFEGNIDVYPEAQWEEMAAKIQKLPRTSEKARKLSRIFIAGATDCQPDSQGRFLLPVIYRDFGNLKKDVVVTGVFDHLEIWDKERWDTYYSETSNDITMNPDEFADLGI